MTNKKAVPRQSGNVDPFKPMVADNTKHSNQVEFTQPGAVKPTALQNAGKRKVNAPTSAKQFNYS